MKMFHLTKKKDRFVVSVFGINFTFYRYLRILRETYLILHFRDLNERLNAKFNINIPKEAYHHLSGDVELVEVALKDIKVPCGHRKTCPIEETKCYKSLFDDPQKIKYPYNEGGIYINSNLNDSVKRIQDLERSLDKGYDPSKCTVVLRKNNVLIDGGHRCSLLYKKYGGEHKILVVREK